MKNIFIFLGLILILVGCNSTKSVQQISTEDFNTIMDQKEIKIKIESANPSASSSMIALQNAGMLGNGNTAGRINLQGNGNFLTISGESIKSHLPFYGERRGSSGFGANEGAIKLIGEVQDYRALWNEKKNRYDISFKAKSKNENFLVYLNIYPNLRTTLSVSGNSRTSIGYTGRMDGSID